MVLVIAGPRAGVEARKQRACCRVAFGKERSAARRAGDLGVFVETDERLDEAVDDVVFGREGVLRIPRPGCKAGAHALRRWRLEEAQGGVRGFQEGRFVCALIGARERLERCCLGERGAPWRRSGVEGEEIVPGDAPGGWDG